VIAVLVVASLALGSGGGFGDDFALFHEGIIGELKRYSQYEDASVSFAGAAEISLSVVVSCGLWPAEQVS
jgi:hypothetical protein